MLPRLRIVNYCGCTEREDGDESNSEDHMNGAPSDFLKRKNLWKPANMAAKRVVDVRRFDFD